MLANKLWLAVALVTALTGCEKSNQEIANIRAADSEINRASIASPEIVGVLANGTPLQRISLQRSGECTGCTTRTHYIYIVDGARSQTVNWVQREGKMDVQYTQATIQLPPSASAEEVIKLADDLKKKQDDAERAQWKKLDQKYGTKQ